MKQHTFTKLGIAGLFVVAPVVLDHADEIAANFGKLTNGAREFVCVAQGATMGAVTVDAIDCSQAGTGANVTPATPTGPSESTGN